jgi:multiple sugar transport system substrate-binding protein
VHLFYGWLNDYVAAELIQPLPASAFPAERIGAEFYPIVQAMKIDGEYRALPTAVQSLALFDNKRLLEQAGVAAPTTLDGLPAAAKATTEREGAGNIATVGLTFGMTGQDNHCWREVLVRQFGGAPYTPDYQTVTYNDAAGLAALKWYIGLTGPEGLMQLGFLDEAQAAFKAGRAALHIDGSFRIGALADARGLDWGVAELPAGPDGTQSNYGSYWVNAITSSADGAE